jgi:SAM-dependent methyltransferase
VEEELRKHGKKCAVDTVTGTKALQEMTPEEIKQAVGDKYSKVATCPQAGFNFPVGRKFAESVGYAQELLAELPAGMYESFTGAGNPQKYVELTAGETLLDLGCGAGLDLYLYARRVGASGRIYGLDISSAMIDKARRNLFRTGVGNFELFCAPADSIPLEDASVDVVTSNGIYNLSPDKEAVLEEVFRVLKPGGRTVFSEIVLKSPLEEEVRKSIEDWFRCIGGALPEEEFLMLLQRVGFCRVEVLSKSRNARCGHKLAVCANIRAYKP